MPEPTRRIRILLTLFIVGLVVSGVTAFPLETELRVLATLFPSTDQSSVAAWIHRVRDGLVETNAKHPFLAYGTDWLAFAHLVIAVVFIGPLRDPVRNVWVIQFGLVACGAVIPFALIAGPVRGIPPGWSLIDCSFGVIGFILLWFAYRSTRRLEGSVSGCLENTTDLAAKAP